MPFGRWKTNFHDYLMQMTCRYNDQFFVLLYTEFYYATKWISDTNKSQYKHQGVNCSKKTTTTTSAFVVFGNVLEASLTICVDQTVPDVGESDPGPHDLPVCLYADMVLCEVSGSRQKKAPLPGKKTLASYFLVFSPNLQLLNSFTEGGGSDFFVWFDSFRPINNLSVI